MFEVPPSDTPCISIFNFFFGFFVQECYRILIVGRLMGPSCDGINDAVLGPIFSTVHRAAMFGVADEQGCGIMV